MTINNTDQNHSKKQAGFRKFYLTLLGFCLFGGIVYFGGLESFRKLSKPNYVWLVCAVISVNVMIFIFACRWGMIANSLAGRKVTTFYNYYFYSLSTLLLGNVLPHTASVVVGRAAALNRFESLPLKSCVASVLLDKLFDGFFMVLLLCPLLLFFLGKATVAGVVVITLLEFLVVTFLIVWNHTMWLLLLHALIRYAVKILRLFPFLRKNKKLQDVEKIDQMDEWNLLKKETVLQTYFLSAFGQLLMTLRAWLASQVVGLGIGPMEMFICIGLLQASVLISITPGALGFADAAWFVVLARAGVPNDIIVVFLVIFRIVENLAILVCWFPLYLYTIWRSGKKLQKKRYERKTR